MSDADDVRLSQLVTRWTLLLHSQRPGAAAAALLPRYWAAVYRYVAGVLGEAAAEEVCQEFCLRFVRGDFRHARPERGRFRDYVRTAVIHLISEFRARRRAA